jgi:galactokinase
MCARSLRAKFEERFHSIPNIYRAPGRVNLIGEHTDYNDGFVLPAAIDLSCWIAIAGRNDRRLVLYSENFDECVEADLDSLKPRSAANWANYPMGVAWALEQGGFRLHGANIYILGEVPLGAGLSSSASVEVSAGYALADLSGNSIELTQLARLCQRAENEFVGARCGIMDQFVSCHGRAGNALFLDCRSLDFQHLRIPPEIHLVICNVMVKHNLASNEYNMRRAECEEGVKLLRAVLPGIRALRDVSVSDLEGNRSLLSETVYRRCRHVVNEIQRTREAASCLQSGQIKALRGLMAASHESLRNDFQVSCSELDVMVEIAMRQPGVLGSRMTGGGFGGCTVNLVEASCSEEFQTHVAEEYRAATGHDPEIYVCDASQGVEKVEQRF